MTDDAWWTDILKWIDFDDYQVALAIARDPDEDRSPLPYLLDKLADMTVLRQTEYSAYLACIKVAWNRAYTKAQAEAKLLEFEAIQRGVTPSRYIAEKRGTTPRAAQRLLKRANGRKMFALPSPVGITGDSVDDWQPARRQINRKLKSMRVDCAANGTRCQRTAPADWCICWNCSQEFGLPGERAPQTAAWLDPMIRAAKRQAYRDARNALYADHRGGLVDSPVEYEAMAMAG